MKILGLINKDSGPGFHRVMMPLLMMAGVDVKITNAATTEDIEQTDIIYYSREISTDIIKEARRMNKKIVVDVDDCWNLDYHHIAYQSHIDAGFARKQIYHIEQADLVTTTHERLQAKISPYNQRCVITPNAIPIHEYFATQRTESLLPRIFWQGSITHERDIGILKNPFKRLTGCGTIIAGYTKHDVWGKMVNAFTDGMRLPGMVLPGVSPMEYYSNYSYADICVAPLVASCFNGYKSNLKVLEAAHSSLPIVCSRVDPYLDLPVLYAEKQTDWFKHLNMLINESGLREVFGKKIHDYCAENYNFDKINKYRQQEFEKLI